MPYKLFIYLGKLNWWVGSKRGFLTWHVRELDVPPRHQLSAEAGYEVRGNFYQSFGDTFNYSGQCTEDRHIKWHLLRDMSGCWTPPPHRHPGSCSIMEINLFTAKDQLAPNDGKPHASCDSSFARASAKLDRWRGGERLSRQESSRQQIESCYSH